MMNNMHAFAIICREACQRANGKDAVLHRKNKKDVVKANMVILLAWQQTAVLPDPQESLKD